VGKKPAGSDARLDAQLNAPLVTASTNKNVLLPTPSPPTLHCHYLSFYLKSLHHRLKKPKEEPTRWSY
jgi:hypothetical protein